VLATRFGWRALEEAVQGRFDVMVAVRGTEMVSVPLADVAGRQRLVPPEGELVCAARSVGTSFGDA